MKLQSLNSAIYTGLVQHRRFLPKLHHFQYRIFMMYLDLDEITSLFDKSNFWSYLTPNLAYFKRADYFGHAEEPLKLAILNKVFAETGKKPQGKICVLTNMRYFGHCFNPVSFYYCYATDNSTLVAIVTHITNTPWGEDFAYVHDCTAVKSHAVKNPQYSFNLHKNFHVSPFMPMDIRYDWRFSEPTEKISVYMQNIQNATDNSNHKMFDATLTLQRQAISTKTLNITLLKYPFMTIKVVFAIYWQALQLWLKRVPLNAHPSS